jgi:endonuclease YncB( thermonuclease family)
MSMLLIEGEYRLQGAAPDGDSIRFYPDKPEVWSKVTGRPVRTNKKGGAQLRIDGIDALETHFNPAGSHFGNIHQPKDLGDKASAELLHFLGFTKVVRDKNQTVTSSAPEQVPGYMTEPLENLIFQEK